MDEEWRTIVDASVPGIEVDEILNGLWKEVYRNESKSACNKDIRNNIEYDSRKSKLVTQSLNRLSKEGKNPSKEAQTTFEHSEIVYYHNGWELTDYGRLLCYYVFEQSQSTQWVQRTALQTEPIVSNKNPNEYNYSGREILEAGVDDCLND